MCRVVLLFQCAGLEVPPVCVRSFALHSSVCVCRVVTAVGSFYQYLGAKKKEEEEKKRKMAVSHQAFILVDAYSRLTPGLCFLFSFRSQPQTDPPPPPPIILPLTPPLPTLQIMST